MTAGQMAFLYAATFALAFALAWMGLSRWRRRLESR